MRSLLTTLNRRYDNMHEPWRVLLMFVLIAPWLVSLNLGQTWGFIGAIYIMALLLVRVWWIWNATRRTK